MQEVIEEVVRLIGWVLLKTFTFGRYRSDGPSALLLEGGVGLAMVVGLVWAGYVLWPR